MLSEVYLSLGSNLGDRRACIAAAANGLRELSMEITMSSLHETAPQGFDAQPSFVNAAARIWTRLDPFELLSALKEVETHVGSRRAFANGPRALDIDILVFGRRVLTTPRLTIPHPRMAEREFVLAPLAEIAPGLRHPVLKETVGELLLRLPRVVTAPPPIFVSKNLGALSG